MVGRIAARAGARAAMICPMPERTHIKICGLREAEHAAAAVDAGADMIGFVFVDASPRSVSLDAASAISATVADRAQCVGVFKDADAAFVRGCVQRVPLSRAQLHGEASDATIAQLAPIPVVRAIAFDPATIEARLRHVDQLHHDSDHIAAALIDTPDPTRLGGGTGVSFDWAALRALLDRVAPSVPIVLAGGLNANNVAEAIRIVRPWGVDVSSGVESSRGVKDPAKIRQFCEAVHTADAARPPA